MKKTKTTVCNKQLEKQLTNTENLGGGLKAQICKNTIEGEDAMKKQKNIEEYDTQVENSKACLIKSAEKEAIGLYEKILKAKFASYKTDVNIIPINQVNVKCLSITELPWGQPYIPEDKINLNAPVVLGRDYSVIAGADQYFNAKENGLTKIDAVFIDSLPWKQISLSNLNKQFKDESVSTSFAYNLYALLYELEYKISYEEFCNDADKLFDEDEMCIRLRQYVSLLNEELI